MPASLWLLLDDIASGLDDVATMTKVATHKTAGVLGDDLALNAAQVNGVRAERELPVVWAVAKGSLVNKAILVPLAVAISALARWAVTPMLMVGGTYLCFEGAEKLAHRYLHPPADAGAKPTPPADPSVDLASFEAAKVKGAIRTDFILSAEIVVIALGTVADEPLKVQLSVLVALSLVMTVGVYGVVGIIVKLDDVGLRLQRAATPMARAVGRIVMRSAPPLLRSLSVLGTAAMFLVGGGILVHGIPPLSAFVHHAHDNFHGLPVVGAVAAAVPLVADGLVGLVAGALALAVVRAASFRTRRAS
jgi:predicted DNA repair protein MutK